MVSCHLCCLVVEEQVSQCHSSTLSAKDMDFCRHRSTPDVDDMMVLSHSLQIVYEEHVYHRRLHFASSAAVSIVWRTLRACAFIAVQYLSMLRLCSLVQFVTSIECANDGENVLRDGGHVCLGRIECSQHRVCVCVCLCLF